MIHAEIFAESIMSQVFLPQGHGEKRTWKVGFFIEPAVFAFSTLRILRQCWPLPRNGTKGILLFSASFGFTARGHGLIQRAHGGRREENAAAAAEVAGEPRGGAAAVLPGPAPGPGGGGEDVRGMARAGREGHTPAPALCPPLGGRHLWMGMVGGNSLRIGQFLLSN